MGWGDVEHLHQRTKGFVTRQHGGGEKRGGLTHSGARSRVIGRKLGNPLDAPVSLGRSKGGSALRAGLVEGGAKRAGAVG